MPGPTAEGAPWDASGHLRDPQQASLWTFCRDEGFTEAQGQSPILLGSGEANRNQPLLRNCLPPAKESNQVSGFFQKRKRSFPAFLSLAFLPGNFSIPAPPVLICVTCPWHWACGSHPHPAHPSHCSTSKSDPKVALLPHERAVVFRAMISCFVLSITSYSPSKQSTDKSQIILCKIGVFFSLL